MPTAVRMVLHLELTRDDLASIKVVTSGTAPLSVEDSEAFTDKFGIPVLTSYAATEFGGGVAGWSLPDHKRYWADKRGSVGRPPAVRNCGVVTEDGTVLAPDEPGLLEVKPGQLGPDADWIRTTDLGKLDEDGFLWILGRADQAIIRGGFKGDPGRRAGRHRITSGRGRRVGGGPPRRSAGRNTGRRRRTAARFHCHHRGHPRPSRQQTGPVRGAHRTGHRRHHSRTPSGKADLRAVRDQLAGATR